MLLRRFAALSVLSLVSQCAEFNDLFEPESPDQDAYLVSAALILAASSTDASLSPEESEFTSLVNAHRIQSGCNSLQNHGGLHTVARAHSNDMQARSYFSHTNPDGQSPSDRLRAAGVSASGVGENIAVGYSSASDVLQGWLNSSGHRANIENCAYTLHGIGLSGEGNYWTHLFARSVD